MCKLNPKSECRPVAMTTGTEVAAKSYESTGVSTNIRDSVTVLRYW